MAVSPNWYLIILGTRIACSPTGVDTIVRAVEDDPTRFFTRDKLQGNPIFRGADFTVLYAVERSSDRGSVIYLECEPLVNGRRVRFRVGQFTCNEVKWSAQTCSCEVSLQPADAYQQLLELWERPVNLLSYTGPRLTSYTTLRELGIYANTRPDFITDGTSLEFMRIDRDQQADYVGTDGWTLFLTNKSWIAGTIAPPKQGVRDKTMIVFRLVKRDIQMTLDDDGTTLIPANLSASGWEVYNDDRSINPPVANYVKAPQISGFKSYLIGAHHEWTNGKYGSDLLLLPCGASSPGPDYIEVTGPDGVNLDGAGGVNNDPECPTCMNVRTQVNRGYCKSLWWRFGRFRFTRGIPLLEALNHLLRSTMPRLAPPQAVQLSRHFSESVSYATGANAVANELPLLQVSAASDIKRYGASESARRLKVSLKQFVEDLCTMYDCGWFIDAETGFFRIEHRSFFAPNPATAIDLTGNAVVLPDSYEYLQAQLPRKEVLSISNAVSEESASANFREAAIEYEPTETNTRPDENITTRTVARLTGDVAGLVLAADSLPDDAIVILAPGAGGVLRDGNRPASAAQLVRRYHRYGRVKLTATVNGEPATFMGVRPQRKQADIKPALCSLDGLLYGATVKTNLSPVATLQEASWNLSSGRITVTALLPPLADLPPVTGLPGTPKQFHTAQFTQGQFA